MSVVIEAIKKMCKTIAGCLHIEESIKKCPKAQQFGSFYMTTIRILQIDLYTKAHICSREIMSCTNIALVQDMDY